MVVQAHDPSVWKIETGQSRDRSQPCWQRELAISLGYMRTCLENKQKHRIGNIVQLVKWLLWECEDLSLIPPRTQGKTGCDSMTLQSQHWESSEPWGSLASLVYLGEPHAREGTSFKQKKMKSTWGMLPKVVFWLLHAPVYTHTYVCLHIHAYSAHV